MNIPRVSEITGIEVGERFYLAGYVCQFFIDWDGVLCYEADDGIHYASGQDWAWLINRPDTIRQTRRWKNQDVADVKTIIRMYSNYTELRLVSREDSNEHGYHINIKENETIGEPMSLVLYIPLSSKMFPHLKIGETASFAEILKCEV